MVWCKVTQSGVAAFGVGIGDVEADFVPGLRQAGKAATLKQFGIETAPKPFSAGIIVAIAAPAHALPRPVAGQ